MPTATLYPDGDYVVTNWTERGSGTDSDGEMWDEVDEGISGADDDTTYIDADAGWDIHFNIDDVPADFSSMNSVTVELRAEKNVTDNDIVRYTSWKITESTDTTTLATVTIGGGGDQLTTAWANYSHTDSSPIGSKSDWTGAILELNFSVQSVQMVDDIREQRITAVEVQIDYNTTGGTVVKDIISCSGIIPFSR